MCRKYHKLPEVTRKVKDARLKEEAQRNRLRAQLYKEVTLMLIAAKNFFAVEYVIVFLLYLVAFFQNQFAEQRYACLVESPSASSVSSEGSITHALT
jgi:hypothetical protein